MKKSGMALLGILSGVFAIVAGTPLLGLMAWLGDDCGAGAVVAAMSIFALLHALGANLASLHCKRKYGLPLLKFALLNTLPMLAVAVLLCAVGYLVSGWNGLFIVIGGFALAGYTVGYAAVLAAVMGISSAIDRKRSEAWGKKPR